MNVLSNDCLVGFSLVAHCLLCLAGVEIVVSLSSGWYFNATIASLVMIPVGVVCVFFRIECLLRRL